MDLHLEVCGILTDEYVDSGNSLCLYPILGPLFEELGFLGIGHLLDLVHLIRWHFRIGLDQQIAVVFVGDLTRLVCCLLDRFLAEELGTIHHHDSATAGFDDLRRSGQTFDSSAIQERLDFRNINKRAQ